MTITYNESRSCRACGRELNDPLSLRYRLGSECRSKMTGEQLRHALELTTAEKQPGYIPPQKPASVDAQLNNRAARTVVEQATAPEVCAAHGGIVGKCPDCRYEVLNPAARIIREVKAMGYDWRRAERIRVLTARYGVLR